MKEIQLTQGKVALVDDEDFERISAHRWFCMNGKYAARGVAGGLVLMHREVLNPPAGLVTDHINGNGLDNRRCNLRACTVAENQLNSKKRSDSRHPYKGIYPKDNKWRAEITIRQQRIRLGYFTTAEAAARAYDEAARKYHGEFARTNFKEGE